MLSASAPISKTPAVQFETRWNGRLVSLERLTRGERRSLFGSTVAVVAGGVVVDGVPRALINDEPLHLSFGPLRLAVSQAPRELAAAGSDIDVGWWRTASVAVILMLGTVMGLRLTPRVPNVDDDAFSRGRLVITRVNLPPPTPPKPEVVVKKQRTPAPALAQNTKTKAPLTMKQKRDSDLKQALSALKAMGISENTAATTTVFTAGNQVALALSQLNRVGANSASGLATRDTGGGKDGTAVGIGVIGTGTSRHGPGDPTGQLIADGRGRRPAVVDSGRFIPQGGLDREEIRRVMDRAMNRVRYCYEKQLTTTPDLEGKLTSFFSIGASGDVVSASALETTLGGLGVEACVTRVLRSLKFPQPRGGGVVTVTYPFVFATR